MAEYFFPSVGLTDKNWNDVLCEYIPKFLASKSVTWTTAELIAELSDTHSVMWPNPIYPDLKLPVELGFVEGKLIVTDSRTIPDEEPVFEPGDEIISINGRVPDYFVERARRYIAASNESALLRDAARLAQRVNDTIVNIIVRRDGEEKGVVVSALASGSGSNSRTKQESSSYELLSDDVGYIKPDECKKSDHAMIMETFADTEAIIVDMRCYPIEFGMFDFIGDYFIPHTTQHVTWTLPVFSLPGYYQKFPASMPLSPVSSSNSDYYKGCVVVLVDATTQSMGEYAVMAFQAAPDFIVVGSQTAGADGNVVELPLPRDIRTMFSGIGVYYPDGTNAQRAGIRIDHYIEPSVEGIRSGRDEILEKALEIIEKRRTKDDPRPPDTTILSTALLILRGGFFVSGKVPLFEPKVHKIHYHAPQNNRGDDDPQNGT